MRPFRILSWGCGVQSTTLAVMSALGHLEPLDAVITADTGWERELTYQARDFYAEWLARRQVLVETVQRGEIKQKAVDDHIHMPLWTSTGGPLKRECTRYFKVRPIRRRARELLGFDPSKPPHPPPGAIELWIGFSWDEWTRAAPSRVKFVKSRWPLLERRLTRNDCIDYLKANGLPVPVKSACIGCPFRSASEYLAMRRQCAREWDEVVAFDAWVRDKKPRPTLTTDSLFVRRERKALPEIDLERAARRERLGKQLPLLVPWPAFTKALHR